MKDIYNISMISIYKDNNFKKYLLHITLIFCGILIFGILCGYFMPHAVSVPVVKYVFEDSVSAKAIELSDGGLKSILFFVNNAIVALMLIIVPLLYYRLVGDNIYNKRRVEPIWISRLMIFLQTILIGVVIGYAAPVINNNVLVVTSLVPHGVFEIFGFLVASALGIWFVKEKYVQEVGYKGLIKMFAIYVLPMIFVAAMIETYITPWLMSLVIK